MSTFIELGVGFNPDLAARDNVVINAIMLGLSPREARERFDRVIEFAELEEFVDLKLKNYSSGMHVRLAFSVMIQVDADVLLIDEVLAVGDASFQQKCFEVFHEMRDQGKTMLFVTHDMDAVRRFCHRALLMERGEVRMIGEPDAVGSSYLDLNFGRDSTDQAERRGRALRRPGRRDPGRVVRGRERRARGHPAPGPRRARSARGSASQPMDEPVVAVLFENEQHHPLFAISTDGRRRAHRVAYAAGDEALFSVKFENPFAPGPLFATPWVLHRARAASRTAAAHDVRDGARQDAQVGRPRGPSARPELRARGPLERRATPA